MTHDDLRELMLLYVADALTQDERAEVEARLNRQDPAALAALAEADAIFSHVAFGTQPDAPSNEMWSKLEHLLDGDTEAQSHGASQFKSVTPARSTWWRTGLAAAALIAITAGFTTWLSTRAPIADDDLAGLRNRVARTTEKLEKTEEALLAARSTLTEAEQQLARRESDIERQRVSLVEQQQVIDSQNEVIEANKQVVAAKDREIRNQNDRNSSQQRTIEDSRARLAEQEQQLARLQAEVDVFKATIKSLRDRIEELEQELKDERLRQGGSQFATDPRDTYTQVASMAGNEELMPTAKARATWDESNFRLSLAGQGFQQLPAGKTYQLWFVTDKQETVSLGTFDIEPDGTVQYDTTYARLANNVAAVAISIEDAGGQLTAPAGDVVVVGTPEKSNG